MSKWQQMYGEKLVSADEAAAAIESGDHIWFPVGAGEPDVFLKALLDRKKTLQGVVTHQILPAKPGYFDEETAPHIRHDSLFLSGASRAAVQGGWADLTKGTISRIVPMLTPGAVVTTSKNDVDHVVTEYGVAKLRGRSLRERAKALIAISHPDFQIEFQREAQKMKLM